MSLHRSGLLAVGLAFASSLTPAAASAADRSSASARRKAPAMTLGMVGLGRMGGNMARRLMKGGHQVIAFDRSEGAVQKLAAQGAVSAATLQAMVDKMPAGKRVVWLMLPAGKITDDAMRELRPMLHPGDVIVDGGNSNYEDTVRRGAELSQHGIQLVDVGTSGGILGAKAGYSMMVGGDKKVVRGLAPIFKTLAPGARTGWGHVGAVGAGHRAKMIHNGIEYAMMQALAEGLDLASVGELGVDPATLTKIWKKGSIVSSLLLDVTAQGLKLNPTLAGIDNVVPDSGEGRWTINDAIKHGVSAPVMSLALMNRFASQRQGTSIANPLQQLMRQQFGGHAIVEKK
jgi:6-phosphogluconate dehydrogenase